MTQPQHDEDAACQCVYEHRPPVLEYNVHHVVPIFLGGEDAPENRLWLCPSTHANAHEVMRMLLKHGPLTYRQVQAMQSRPVARYAYDVAAEGYRRWKATQP